MFGYRVLWTRGSCQREEGGVRGAPVFTKCPKTKEEWNTHARSQHSRYRDPSQLRQCRATSGLSGLRRTSHLPFVHPGVGLVLSGTSSATLATARTTSTSATAC